MTHNARFTAIQELGYTKLEIALRLPADPRGCYSLRLGCRTFTEACRNRTDHLLVRKVIQKRRRPSEPTDRHPRLYCLCSRVLPFGEFDYRNCGRKLPGAINAAPLSLGVVPEHRKSQSLATEHEKVSFSPGSLGLGNAILPTQIYYRKTTVSLTERHSVDRYPVCVCAPGNSPALAIASCHINDGAAAWPRFETFLEHCARLCAAFWHFRIVYVAIGGMGFPLAQAAVELFEGPARGMPSGRQTAALENFAECVRFKHLLRAERFGELNAATADPLKHLRKPAQECRNEELFPL
jgi:hypothetical protein